MARNLSKRKRFEILKRDDFTCQYCGRRSPQIQLQVDHRKPVKHGGTNEPSNLVTSCFDCNSGKSDQPLCAEDDFTKGWGWGEFEKAKDLFCLIVKDALEPEKTFNHLMEQCKSDAKLLAPEGACDISPSEWLSAYKSRFPQEFTARSDV